MKRMLPFYAMLLATLLLFPSQTVFSEAEASAGPEDFATPGIAAGPATPAARGGEDEEEKAEGKKANENKDAAAKEIHEDSEAVATGGVYNVTLPTSLDFMLDPLEIKGRGMVYSEQYLVENHGETDVALVVTGAEVIAAEGADIEQLAEPFDMAAKSSAKAVYLLMDFGREDIAPVIMTAPENSFMPVIPLYAAGRENSTCTISISGSVNPYPQKKWAAGDMKIKFTYTIEPLWLEEADL